MGNRVKGKPKRKSIKAASHSGMGSKRKLSRMGKKQKKDHAGLDATFIGRASCLRRLQVSLKEFRRLCILKGVYPREPRGRAPGNKKGQTYYHIKDIRAIAHEPLLDKFREFRSFMKKVRKAAGRNEKDEAARKHATAPTYSLHHLVRERYPRFSDALNDLDDALTLCFLFAALPSQKGIKAKVTNKAKAIAGSWAAYCATTSAITRGFISVKGVYIEASIQSCTIRWVVPHSFTQHMPKEVDFSVMRTFFEFYETLLGFVLFKLYNELGLRYPLTAENLAGEGAGNTSSVIATNLKAMTAAMQPDSGGVSDIVSESLKKSTPEQEKKETSKKDKELIKSVGTALKQISDDEDEDEDEDVDIAGPLRAALDSMEELHHCTTGPATLVLDDEAIKRKRLFAGLTFFLSREVPRGYLELVCLAFGGRVGWEGPNSPIAASDPSITHHIVDRPKLTSSYDNLPKSREFIQPQWILDSANFVFLLPVGKYAVGASLPPHLSPWVDDEEEGYKPAYAEEIERLKNGEVAPELEEDDRSIEADAGNATTDMEEVEEEEDEEEEEEDVQKEKAEKAKSKEEKEAHDRAKIMMSKKASRLYGRMQRGIAKKSEKSEKLQLRREELSKAKEKSKAAHSGMEPVVAKNIEKLEELQKKSKAAHRGMEPVVAKNIEKLEELQKKRVDIKGKGKGSAGETALKQKVGRLKKERKTVEDEYTDSGGSMKKSKKQRSK